MDAYENSIFHIFRKRNVCVCLFMYERAYIECFCSQTYFSSFVPSLYFSSSVPCRAVLAVNFSHYLPRWVTFLHCLCCIVLMAIESRLQSASLIFSCFQRLYTKNLECCDCTAYRGGHGLLLLQQSSQSVCYIVPPWYYEEVVTISD